MYTPTAPSFACLPDSSELQSPTNAVAIHSYNQTISPTHDTVICTFAW